MNAERRASAFAKLKPAGHGAGRGCTRPPNSERSEAFIVRMAVTTKGQPTRCTVTHVRTQTEKPWAGWSSGEVIGFIEKQLGMAKESALGIENTSKPPAPAGRPTESRDHVVVLDAGKAVGGSRRNLELIVSTARLADISEFEYQVTLAGRTYGQTTEDWAALADQTGYSHPPGRMPLRFEAAELPPGVQRLRLQLALRRPAPKQEKHRRSSSGNQAPVSRSEQACQPSPL